jgi:ferredoxin
VAAKIIGLDPGDIYTTKHATGRRLGIGSLQDIEILGERLEDVTVSDFKLPAGVTSVLTRKVPRHLARRLLSHLSVRPRIVASNCTGCYECENVCPVSAISRVNTKVEINHRRCIGCMCCNEVCRYGAIIPKRPMVGNALELLTNAWQKLMNSIR